MIEHNTNTMYTYLSHHIKNIDEDTLEKLLDFLSDNYKNSITFKSNNYIAIIDFEGLPLSAQEICFKLVKENINNDR